MAVETQDPAPVTDNAEKSDKEELKKEEDVKEEEKKDEGKENKKEQKETKKKEVVKAPPPPAVHKKDFEKDVVYLYQFNRTPKVPSISPYCLKVETWLKFHGIKYENVNHNGKLRSKQGLLPFVELNGEEIPDSEFIIKTLTTKLEKDMDQGLSGDQTGVQHAMTTMIDNHLNWCFNHWLTRNIDNPVKGYNLNLQNMMGCKIPTPVLQFVVKHTYFKKTTRRLKAAGFGSYTADEVDEMGKKDLKVLSDLLGEKQFFFGDEARSLDLKAFVWLALILNVDKEVKCPLRDYIEEECKNLVGVYDRMKDRAWGEHWAEATGEKLEMNPHIPKPEPPKEEEKKDEAKEEKEEKKDEEKKEKEDKEKDNKEEEK